MWHGWMQASPWATVERGGWDAQRPRQRIPHRRRRPLSTQPPAPGRRGVPRSAPLMLTASAPAVRDELLGANLAPAPRWVAVTTAGVVQAERLRPVDVLAQVRFAMIFYVVPCWAGLGWAWLCHTVLLRSSTLCSAVLS